MSFSPQQPAGRPKAASLDVDVASQAVEELPYGAHTERTIALGKIASLDKT